MSVAISESIEKGIELPIMEQFYTIQGEGAFSGVATYFIRLGGCDVGCHWCDVKESWDFEKHPALKTDTVVNNAVENSNIAVITGGEPLMWNLDYLTTSLQEKGVRTHIETSGSSPVTGNWDWMTLSPKKRKLPVQEAYDIAHELKIIIFNKDDFKFAEEQAAKVNNNCKLYLQVEWSKKNEMTPLMVEYVKKNPKWRISTQTHKYMDIP